MTDVAVDYVRISRLTLPVILLYKICLGKRFETSVFPYADQ